MNDAVDLRQVAQRCLWLVMVVTPFVFVPIGKYNDFFYLPKVIFYTGVVGVFGVFVLLHLKQFLTLLSVDKINVLLLVLTGLFVLSAWFAMDVGLALSGNVRRVEGLSTILTYFVLFLMARISYPFTKKQITVFLLVVGVIALYGIFQTFDLDPFARDFLRSGWSRAFSTIGNPNFLGAYLVLVLPLASDRYMRTNDNKALLLYALLAYALLATMTRGAWVGAGLSHLIYAVLLWKTQALKPKRAICFIGTTLLVFVAYNIISSGTFLDRFISIQRDVQLVVEGLHVEGLSANALKAGSSRLFIWEYTSKIVWLYPWFGVGIENLGLAFQTFYSDDIIEFFGRMVIPDKAHNEYLHLAATAGIFTLMTYVSLLWVVLKKSANNLLNDSYRIGLWIGVLGYIIQAFFNISVVSVAYLFWIFLGLLANTSNEAITNR